MTALAADHDVLVPEHPGFGGSDEPAWFDTIHDLAYFYLDLLDRLNLRDVFVVGSSIGGWLALEIAIRNCDRIAAVALASPAGLYVPGLRRGDIFLWSAEEKARNLYFDQALAERALARVPTPLDVDIEFKNQHGFARVAWEPRLFDPHLSKWLHRVTVPTQIIWGADDKVIPAGYAAEFARLIPDSAVEIIPQCGHLPHVEKPEPFVRILRAFEASAKNKGRAA